jgi:hypothetical protein
MEQRSLIPLLNAAKEEPWAWSSPRESSTFGFTHAEITAKNWLILAVCVL